MIYNIMATFDLYSWLYEMGKGFSCCNDGSISLGIDLVVCI